MSKNKRPKQPATDEQRDTGFYLPGTPTKTLARLERLFSR